MPSWLVKAAIHRAIALLPKSEALNYLFQKHVTKSVRLTPEWYEHKVEQCRKQLENYARWAPGGGIPARCMEIGTGWHPITPVGLWLCGVEAVWTVDIVHLLHEETVHESIAWYARYAREGRLATMLPRALPERLAELERLSRELPRLDVPEILAAMNITSLVRDARDLPFDAGSIDLILSHNTFEHIATAVFEGLYREMRRVIRPTGIMSHFIDMSDHYSHFDGSLTNWHFLRYSDAQWRLLDSPIVPQNRLRISEHRRFHERGGFAIVHEEQEHVRERLPESVVLADRFKEYAVDDLLVTHCWVISRPHR